MPIICQYNHDSFTYDDNTLCQTLEKLSEPSLRDIKYKLNYRLKIGDTI